MMRRSLGALSILFAIPVIYAALVRVGWRRHGAVGLGFLDWVGHRELPFWGAHLANLAWLAIGVLLLLAGFGVFVRSFRSPAM